MAGKLCCLNELNDKEIEAIKSQQNFSYLKRKTKRERPDQLEKNQLAHLEVIVKNHPQLIFSIVVNRLRAQIN